VVEAPPAPTGDPTLVGLPAFIVGSIGLGLTFVEFVPLQSQAASVPVILGATVIGLIVATVWAARLAQNAVAAVFGVFSGFWLSYSLLLLGLGHGWFGIIEGDISRTVQMFAISWLAVVVVLTLSTLALPSAFTLLFVLVDLALAFVWVAANQNSTTMWHLAGWAVFGFTAVGIYLWIGSLLVSTGKKGLPLGPSVIK
jgi:hypothetical protein